MFSLCGTDAAAKRFFSGNIEKLKANWVGDTGSRIADLRMAAACDMAAKLQKSGLDLIWEKCSYLKVDWMDLHEIWQCKGQHM